MPIQWGVEEKFVGATRGGMVRCVFLDQGFHNGTSISRFKRKHKIGFLIPVLSNMDVQADVMCVKEEVSFKPYQPTEIQQCRHAASEVSKGERTVKRELGQRRTL